MGFDKFKSFIASAIYEDDEQPSAGEQQNNGQQPVAQQTIIQPVVGSISTSQPVQSSAVTIDANGNIQYTGKVREKFAQLMLEGVQERNIPGPDFLEMREQWSNAELQQNIPDSNARWKTVFSMIRMMDKNFTKQHVLDSVDTYVKVVDEELANALAQIEKKYQSTVGNKEQELANAEKLIEKDRNEILSLQEKIKQIQDKIKGNEEFIATAREEINNGKIETFVDKADLQATADAIKNNLIADKTTLTTILPNE